MDSKRVKAALFQVLKQPLAGQGFRLQRSNMFVREGVQKHDVFWIIITPLDAHVEVSATIACAFEAIEGFMRKDSGLYVKPQGLTLSVARDLWRSDPAALLQVQNEEEAVAAAGQLIAMYWKYAVPFYADLSELSDVVSATSIEQVHSGNLAINCSVGLIARKLTGSIDYESYFAACKERLSSLHNGFYESRFVSLAQTLSGGP